MNERCNLCGEPGVGVIREGLVWLCRECAEEVRSIMCEDAEARSRGEEPDQRAEGHSPFVESLKDVKPARLTAEGIEVSEHE